MSMDIIGIGTYSPPHGMTRDEACEAAAMFCLPEPQQARILPALYRKSGVEQRYHAILEKNDGPPVERQTLYQPASSATDRGPTTAARMQRYESIAAGMGLQAARTALADADCDPSRITHLVTVSCSGFAAPGIDIALIDQLGLKATTARTHVGFMGCHGAMNGLRVAHAFAQSNPKARVLMCAVEMCSLHYRFGWDPDAIITNALFADGAAAAVCVPESSQGRWRLLESSSMVMPNSTDAMTWRVGDHGFEMTLSAKVPELIHRHLKPWLEEWLGERGESLATLQTYAVHPGGPRILQAVTEALLLDPAALSVSRSILADYGNMSSPTVIFVLQRLLQEQKRHPCLALGFGPGLAAEAMRME